MTIIMVIMLTIVTWHNSDIRIGGTVGSFGGKDNLTRLREICLLPGNLPHLKLITATCAITTMTIIKLYICKLGKITTLARCLKY